MMGTNPLPRRISATVPALNTSGQVPWNFRNPYVRLIDLLADPDGRVLPSRGGLETAFDQVGESPNDCFDCASAFEARHPRQTQEHHYERKYSRHGLE